MSTIFHNPTYTPAEARAQFSTSSIYPVPTYTAWEIRNDYPAPKPEAEWLEWIPDPDAFAPWLNIDPRKNPQRYMAIAREYCFEGMIENGFIPQKNKVRDWYHAPWLHYGPTGREPLNGLRLERFVPEKEFSATQNRTIQVWAAAYYNSPAASVFGGMWQDPAKPDWSDTKRFPLGSLIFKIIVTDATDEEVPSMVGSPTWDAVICSLAGIEKEDPSLRNDFVSKVRILQMDIATRDHRSVSGWIFATHMYNGKHKAENPWYKLVPVGLMWGNDPEVNQAAYEAGKRPEECWFNPEGSNLIKEMGGNRPWWGWNERFNGPADGFLSACMSCHSTSEWPHKGVDLIPKKYIEKKNDKWVPKPGQDPQVMQYYRNLPWGTPFTDGAVSGDMCMQLMGGYDNFTSWAKSETEWNNISHFKKLPILPRQG